MEPRVSRSRVNGAGRLERLGVLVLAIVVVACASTPEPTASSISTDLPPANSPSQSVASPSPSPSPAIAVAPVTAAVGGGVTLPSGASLVLPAGAVSADTTATASEAGPDAFAGPTPTWPVRPVGSVIEFALGSAELLKPATISLPFDPATLSEGVTPGDLLLAYLDAETDRWVPVPVEIDLGRSLATAEVSHLSLWALFEPDLDYWLAFLKKTASGDVTQFLQATRKLLTKCVTSTTGYVVDNSTANKMIHGCITKADAKSATIEVTNLRAYSLEVSDPVGYLDPQPILLDPGDSRSFTVKATERNPITVAADLSADGILKSIVDVLLRLVPGDEQLRSTSDFVAGSALIYKSLSAVYTATEIMDELEADRLDVAVEKTLKLVTDPEFIEAFTGAARAAGAKFGIPALQAVNAKFLTKALLVVNLGDLIVTVYSWDADYFFNAHTEVSVTWEQLRKPSPPTNLSMTNTTLDPCTTETWDGTVPPYGCNLFALSWSAPTGASSYHLFACVNGFEYVTLCRAGGKPFATLPGTTTSLKLAAAFLQNPSFAISAIGPGGESPIVQFPTQ